MELMSSLLLCVLVAPLPQTLGKSGVRLSPNTDLKFNNTLLIQKPHILRKQLLINVNGPSLVSDTVSESQSVYSDIACKRCQSCMERALTALRDRNIKVLTHPNVEELEVDMLTNEISYRTKRDIAPTDKTVTSSTGEMKTTRKSRAKKNKNRAVMVTKYNIDGDVYALKVKEQLSAEENETKSASTCQVYSVKKSFSCESVEGEALLTSAKRKANKRKAKKEQGKTSSTSTTTQSTKTSVFRKREVDNSQVPENFMPSIEEMY